MVSKGQIVGIDWNRIARLHSHVLAHMISLTASHCRQEDVEGTMNVIPRIYLISCCNFSVSILT